MDTCIAILQFFLCCIAMFLVGAIIATLVDKYFFNKNAQ